MIIWISIGVAILITCIAALFTRYKPSVGDIILSAIAGFAAGILLLFCGNLIIFNFSTIDNYTFVEESAYPIVEAHTSITDTGYYQYTVTYDTDSGHETKVIEAANARVNYVDADESPMIQMGRLKHPSDTISWLFSVDYPISVLTVPGKE